MRFTILWPFAPSMGEDKKATWHIVNSLVGNGFTYLSETHTLCNIRNTELSFFNPKEIIGKENSCKACEEVARAIGLIKD